MHDATAKEPVDTDVLIAGAGPVGLALANLMALRGAGSIVLEQLDDLIDYPRAVGIDDESLRSVQAMGLIDEVLPHTAPNHIMRMVNARGRSMVEIRPATQEFGWSRRNGFVQPVVDRVLYEGLSRFDGVEVRFGHEITAIRELPDRVVAEVRHSDGTRTEVSARWLVGCEGGRSLTRRHIGVSFDGQSPPTRWIVIDIANDPLGIPNVYIGGDPRRPWASLGLPGAVRRFEFMLFDDEPDELTQDDSFIARILDGHVPDPMRVDIIRRRVYTHHSRIAGSFHRGRIFLAGDAAHLMPIWQGQGYNSGLRDATNLAWKLAGVVTGRYDEAVLETYTTERQGHAKAMVDISTAFGRIAKPTNRLLTGARDVAATVLNLAPGVKTYFAQMRYKPMPRYLAGVVVDAATLEPGRSDVKNCRRLTPVTSASLKVSPVGTQFPQPRVAVAGHDCVLLDDVIGHGWGVIIYGAVPEEVFSAADLDLIDRLGATLVTVRPTTQATIRPTSTPGAVVAADITGALKRWFDDRPAAVVFLRPDRFVAAACLIQEAPRALSAVAQATFLRSAPSSATSSRTSPALAATPLEGAVS